MAGASSRKQTFVVEAIPERNRQRILLSKECIGAFPGLAADEPVHEGHPPKTNHYVVVDNLASLLYLANLGCIDQNPWLSRIGSLEHPDWVLIDLDPVECPFDQLVEAAQVVKRILNQLGLKGYPKTTGGDGLHVYVPIDPIYSYDQARRFAEILFHLAMEASPDLFTSPRSVGRRKKNRVYFDWMQIGTGKTIAAPYVLRAYDHAPVSTPLEWSEVKPGLLPTNFTIKNAIARFKDTGDLFAPVLKGGQRLETALTKAGVRPSLPLRIFDRLRSADATPFVENVAPASGSKASNTATRLA